jgi:UMF1 family MFS transporter
VEGLTVWFNGVFDAQVEVQTMFLYIGVIAGLSLGSSQSASRALVGLFSPEEKSAEFFGFWGLSNKLAAVFGIIGIGILQTQFGLQRSVLFCAFLFLIAMVITVFVNEKRGTETADAYTESKQSM